MAVWFCPNLVDGFVKTACPLLESRRADITKIAVTATCDPKQTFSFEELEQLPLHSMVIHCMVRASDKISLVSEISLIGVAK